ncbi:antiterminator LoaP [Ruminiclostridium cellulolyticum]|uniref:NusG antitermination factor n=1 Tax=Ruminiclostridium cellulolyticum (strain ATCC 35319 / DSM 5812 / JCM 6584 / H10) TaxID=394503 RepID=B8I8J0_RUMCH|nr:antiterminator LoaP [Ruminiclostridium cellulolyticum]ACL75223.1 NusG antitermination factor [Ruminiclostridium cellulolyticum H10]
MYWYVLFVRTGREENVKKLLSKRLDKDLFLPFVPLNERIFKKAGTVNKNMEILFPGYVFIESKVASQEFVKMTNELMKSLQDIIRLVRYSDIEIAVRESERIILQSLYNNNNCIESSSGIIKGDKIYIIDGPLRGRESIVRHINRHKREAKIEIEFMGNIRLVSVSLEIVQKL